MLGGGVGARRQRALAREDLGLLRQPVLREVAEEEEDVGARRDLGNSRPQIIANCSSPCAALRR